jgi:hypothetical protein
MGPLLTLITPLFYWRSPLHLFFTYAVPILPFVMVADGYISVRASGHEVKSCNAGSQAMRTRTPRELLQLIQECTSEDERAGWTFSHDYDSHAPIIGNLYHFVGTKSD